MNPYRSNGLSKGPAVECFHAGLLTEPEKARPAPKRVLLVDDRPVLLELLKCCFEGEDFETHTTNNGKTALDMFNADHFDVVVTELAIPGINGTHLAKLVKSHRPGTPVILLTGFSKETTESLTTVEEIDEVIYKPFQPRMLRSAIRIILEEMPVSRDSSAIDARIRASSGRDV
ncbi:MAG: response regulator [Planctomycetota bacterium]|nr:response regulator [Planctomycetota bacterium]MDA1141064.1 response regulator [Planctomycetota bacterium]